MGDEATLPSGHSVFLGQCWGPCPSGSPRPAPGSEEQTQDRGGHTAMSEMWGQRFSPSLPSLQALDTETQRGRGTSVRTQTPDPGTCPTLAQPHICPRRAGGWWGTWCQAPEAGWEAEWSLAPPPPPGSPAWLHPPGCPAAGTSAQARTSIHTRALAPSFFSALLFPPQLESFFFSPLSLPTCHYSRNKKRGDNAGIDGSPLPAPSPRGACQHSFHPPRAGTAAKGAMLINKRNQINQEHNRGICCT